MSVVAGAAASTMIGEILLNLSRFVSNPVTLDWVHHLLVRSEEAQVRLDQQLAAEKLEPPPEKS